jgi:hypothetical protein
MGHQGAETARGERIAGAVAAKLHRSAAGDRRQDDIDRARRPMR